MKTTGIVQDNARSAVFDEHPELFHYTNGGGLAGILSTSTLWATDIHSLNDMKEQHLFYDNVLPGLASPPLNHAIERLKHSLKYRQLIKDLGVVGAKKHIFDGTIAEFKAIALLMHRHFVLSLSCPGKNVRVQQHGLLSQWRAYGGENSYAIVFDKTLHSAFAQEFNFYRGEAALFGDVQYDGIEKESSQSPEYQNSLNTVTSGLSEHFSGKGLSDDQSFFQSLTHLACFTKHWGFSEEREVRVLVSLLGNGLPASLVADDPRPDRKTHTRKIGSGSSATYIEIFGSPKTRIKLPIQRIIVGPSNDPVVAHEFARQTAAAAGYAGVPIFVSDIPFRPSIQSQAKNP